MILTVDSELDDLNQSIVTQLQADGRVTIAELGRRIGLSAPAVAERVARLESEGAIRGYRAEMDPGALGYSLAAIVRVRPTAGRLQRIADVAEGIPAVVECYRTTGEDCFYIKVHLRDIGELGEILDDLLPYGQTTTSIIQSTYVERPLPPAGTSG